MICYDLCFAHMCLIIICNDVWCCVFLVFVFVTCSVVCICVYMCRVVFDSLRIVMVFRLLVIV